MTKKTNKPTQEEKLTEFEKWTKIHNYLGIKGLTDFAAYPPRDTFAYWDRLIFKHDFLRAFFGEENTRIDIDNKFDSENYKRLSFRINNPGWGIGGESYGQPIPSFYGARWEFYAQQLVLIPEEERVNWLYDQIAK